VSKYIYVLEGENIQRNIMIEKVNTYLILSTTNLYKKGSVCIFSLIFVHAFHRSMY
jgi:hypothetical protein